MGGVVRQQHICQEKDINSVSFCMRIPNPWNVFWFSIEIMSALCLKGMGLNDNVIQTCKSVKMYERNNVLFETHSWEL